MPWVAAWVVVLGGAGATSAHGELILQLGAERVQPGGSIEVRGDLGAGEAFEVALISKADGSRRLIGTIPAIAEGHFQTFVTIPADVAAGAYLLEVAVDLLVVRAPLEVAGSPIQSESGGDGPDHADPLVQPMPGSSAPSGATTSGATAPLPAKPASGRSGRSPVEGIAIVAVAVLAAAALTAVLRLANRRRGNDRPGAPRPG